MCLLLGLPRSLFPPRGVLWCSHAETGSLGKGEEATDGRKVKDLLVTTQDHPARGSPVRTSAGPCSSASRAECRCRICRPLLTPLLRHVVSPSLKAQTFHCCFSDTSCGQAPVTVSGRPLSLGPRSLRVGGRSTAPGRAAPPKVRQRDLPSRGLSPGGFLLLIPPSAHRTAWLSPADPITCVAAFLPPVRSCTVPGGNATSRGLLF